MHLAVAQYVGNAARESQLLVLRMLRPSLASGVARETTRDVHVLL